MPDYSKTQIYKIVCKDSNINKFYIGSTTNWTRRKQHHKESCIYEKDKRHHLKIYEIMRENGGFENFNMILVEDYPCENRRQAEQREQYWKDLLKPDMNTINAYLTEEQKKEYIKYKIKEYRINNKELVKEYKKEYNQRKFTCDCCKIELSLHHKARHEKSKTHINNSLKESEN